MSETNTILIGHVIKSAYRPLLVVSIKEKKITEAEGQGGISMY
jgi:hypothetical protein